MSGVLVHLVSSNVLSSSLYPLLQALFTRASEQAPDEVVAEPQPIGDLVLGPPGERTVTEGELRENCLRLVEQAPDGTFPDGMPGGSGPDAARAAAVAAALSGSLLAMADSPLDDVQAVELGAEAFAASLRATNSVALQRLSAAEATAHDVLLERVCAQVLHVLTERPGFPVPTRASRHPGHSAFEDHYRLALAHQHGSLTLFGVQVADATYAPDLDVGHVPRTVSGTRDGRPVRESAETLLNGHDRVLLLGAPGAGKTTQARRLILDPATERVPFFLSARLFAKGLYANGQGLPWPGEFVPRQLAGVVPEGWEESVLRDGRGLIVVDGVDAVPHLRQDIQRWMTRLLRLFPGNQWLVTARTSTVPDGWLARHAFVERELLPLDEQGSAALIERWFRGQERAALGDRLLRLLDRRPDLRELASNALLCAYLCALHREQPDLASPQRRELYEAFLLTLLDRRDRERGIETDGADGAGVTGEMARVVLRTLAYWLQRNGRTTMDVDIAVLQIDAALRPMAHLGPMRAADLLHHLVARTGIVRQPTADTVEFSWRPLRDHLAAVAAVETGDLPLLARYAHDADWQETFLLAVESARPRERAQLVEGLLDQARSAPAAPDRTRCYALAAAAAQRSPLLDQQIRAAVDAGLASVLPPGSEAEARALEVLGPDVLSALPGPADVTETQASLIAVLAARLGGPEGAEAVRRYTLHRSEPTPAPPAPPPEPARRTPPALPELPAGARDLAVALSVATRIEPELLRAVRLRVFPLHDAGDEADLWFSPWVAARTRRAIALRPDTLPQLRAELTRRLAACAPDDPLRAVGDLIAHVHRDLTPALVLEEQVNWASVCGPPGDKNRAAAMERALQPALRAVAEGREGIADWLAGAWERLPEEATHSVTGWQLATSAARYAPDLDLAMDRAPDDLSSGDVALIAELLPDAVLPVRRVGGQLHLGALPGEGHMAIVVPDSRPRVVDVLVGDGTADVRTVRVAADEVAAQHVGDARVRLRTARGAVYELEPETPAATPSGGQPDEPSTLRFGTEPGDDFLLRGSAGDLHGIAAADLVRDLRDVHLARHGDAPEPQEVARWEEGVPALTGLLVDAGLGDCEVIVAYTLPEADTRVDAVVVGVGPSFVVVELSPWRAVAGLAGDPSLCLLPTAPEPELHPGIRVRDCCAYLLDHHRLGEHPERVAGMAYLHQAAAADVSALWEQPEDRTHRLFTADGRAEALAFLRAELDPLRPDAAVHSLLAPSSPFPHLEARPRTGVLTALVPALDGRSGFVPLDEQRLALQTVLAAARPGPRPGQDNEVVVVTGGPGSGKTALSVMLLEETLKAGADVRLTAGSDYHMAAVRQLALDHPRDVVRTFPYAAEVRSADPGPHLDVLICDEAQDLDRRSVEALMGSATLPVFLLDEGKSLLPAGGAALRRLHQVAAGLGVRVRHIELTGQFGSGGTRAYPQWVTHLLGGGADARRWQPGHRYALAVADGLEDLEAALRERLEQGWTARMTAGYCWEPTTSHGRGPQVTVAGRTFPWNARRRDDAYPPWPTAPDRFGELDSVYAARSFAFDWCGVILGPDLLWRDGRWVTDRLASTDPALRSVRVPDADVDRHIRNAYRILLTRAGHGTVVHSTDPETRARLRELVAEP